MKNTYKGKLDSPAHHLVEKFMRVVRSQKSVLERQLNNTGVFRSQHQILMYVADNPNASQKEIAKLYGVSSPTIAVSLKKLEKGGYIERIVDEKDNRFNQIRITEKGRTVVSASVRIFRHMENCMFEGFSEEEYKVMGDLLDRMYRNLQKECSSRQKERTCK